MNIRKIIKIIIESKKCPVHSRNPTVDSTHTEIRITACCKTFHVECVEQVGAILTGIDTTRYWKVA
jgi:hypothetical protein